VRDERQRQEASGEHNADQVSIHHDLASLSDRFDAL
jgi:hypothetical protein